MRSFFGVTAIEEINDALNSLSQTVSSLADAFHSAVNAPGAFAHGDRAKVYHEQTGAFYGHICETRSDATVTVVRESDGVLVHLPRSEIVWTVSRGGSDD